MSGQESVQDLHVLRLASVFEVSAEELGPDAARFDAVGGMQTHTAALTRNLDALGIQQSVITSRLAGPTGRRPIGRHGHVIRVGVRMARWRQMWAVAALRHVLRPGRRVDLVHVHQGEDIAVLLLGRLAARVHRCPLVATVHTSVTHTMRARSVRERIVAGLGSVVERRVLAAADAVVVLAERTRRLMGRNGIAPDRLHRIPSGFEPRLFAGGAADPFPQIDRPRVAYVGRLAAQKSPEHVVEAFDLVTTPAQLLIVGDGPHREAVEARVARSSRAESIHLVGFVPHDAVPAVLAAVDVLVMPSAYEELGSVLIEAAAAGVPAVAARVGGIPEVVLDGETGVLVDPGDFAAFAAGMDKLLVDPDLRQRMSSLARAHAGDYAWPTLARQILRLYREVLSGRREPDQA